MKLTDYTMEYCPWCDKEVVIHAHGVTRCPSCGAPLAPCSVCAYENGGCKKTARMDVTEPTMIYISPLRCRT